MLGLVTDICIILHQWIPNGLSTSALPFPCRTAAVGSFPIFPGPSFRRCSCRLLPSEAQMPTGSCFIWSCLFFLTKLKAGGALFGLLCLNIIKPLQAVQQIKAWQRGLQTWLVFLEQLFSHQFPTHAPSTSPESSMHPRPRWHELVFHICRGISPLNTSWGYDWMTGQTNGSREGCGLKSNLRWLHVGCW